MEYDLDSNPVDPRGRESVRERFIHGEIFKARPDVNAVVHNHSPSVVPFSVTTVAMRPLFHMAAFVGEGLPNFEIRDAERGTDLLIKTPYLGQALAKTLGNCPAALMRGHGSVTGGESLPRAVGRSIYLETSAPMQLQAIAIPGPGGKITSLDDPEVRASVPSQDYKRAWPMWRAKALAGLKPRARAARPCAARFTLDLSTSHPPARRTRAPRPAPPPPPPPEPPGARKRRGGRGAPAVVHE